MYQVIKSKHSIAFRNQFTKNIIGKVRGQKGLSGAATATLQPLKFTTYPTTTAQNELKIQIDIH